MSPRALCAKKISTDEGGLSQSPPVFLGPQPCYRDMREAVDPLSLPISEFPRRNPTVTFPGHIMCWSDAWSERYDLE